MRAEPHSPAAQPATRKYLLVLVIALVVVIPLWAAADLMMFHSEVLSTRSETGMNIARWIGLPAVLITMIVGGHWLSASHQAHGREKEWAKKNEIVREQEARAKTEQGRREYVLEVIGLGVTVEKYRQGALWKALQKGNWHATIREQDPNKYEWSRNDKDGVSGGRANDAMENGGKHIPVYWSTPSFYAGAPIADPAAQPSAIDPIGGLVSGAETNGLPEQLFVIASWKLDERPDRLLEEIFAFFDAHPDVPYVALAADDSLSTRDMGRPKGAEPQLKDGYYIPAMPDATAFFILARRERIEPLRPFVFDDPDENVVSTDTLNNDSFARRLYLAHGDLQNSVPTVEKLTKPDSIFGRLPTVAEWLPFAAAFANRPEIRGSDVRSHLNDFKPWSDRPPRDWKPTPWFPIPWNRFQMETFDKLPTFGFIHRPTFVKFVDSDGKPVTHRDERQKILAAGWQEALLSLPEAERTKGPARIIAAFGDKTEQEILLDTTLTAYAAQGGPTFDSNNIEQFINMDRRIGNTGAATFFVQMAIGVLGSYQAGGVSAAINLRDPTEASIIFIAPPPEAKRKEQESRDLLRTHVTPSIDPANYKAPSVESIISSQQAGQVSKEPHSVPLPTKAAGK